MNAIATGNADSAVTFFETIEKLLTATSSGDAQAFERLYDLTAPRVLGLVSRVLGPGPVAQEVTARVFEDLWTGAESPAEHDSLPWLLVLAHSRAVTQLRGRVPRQRRPQAVPHHPPFPPDRDWLPGLTEEERDVLCQVYLRGQTHSETDERLELAPGTTVLRLQLAMLHLAEVVNASVAAEAVPFPVPRAVSA